MLEKFFQRFREHKRAELPGYAPLERIHDGNLSVIFKAREQSTGRVVAVKVCKPQPAKERSRGPESPACPTEGAVLAALDHPNVVKCIAHGDLAGTPYAVLEYLQGPTLAAVLAEDLRALDGRRLQILGQLAAAIAHVHSRRFIHRDVCPKNVVLASDGRLRLIDFALATPTGTAVSAGRLGTLETLAPELMKREPFDHRVDIFAWGVVAYEVLSGRWPFESAEQHTIPAKILNVRPLPIERRDPRVPPEVANVIMRCLEKEPTRRLPSMTAAIAAIDRCSSVAL